MLKRKDSGEERHSGGCDVPLLFLCKAKFLEPLVSIRVLFGGAMLLLAHNRRALSAVIMARRLRAGVHDVAQSLKRIGVVLICRKAIPIFANRTLVILLSGNRRTSPSHRTKNIVLHNTGLLLLGGSD